MQGFWIRSELIDAITDALVTIFYSKKSDVFDSYMRMKKSLLRQFLHDLLLKQVMPQSIKWTGQSNAVLIIKHIYELLR
jgi:hypothetical protein